METEIQTRRRPAFARHAHAELVCAILAGLAYSQDGSRWPTPHLPVTDNDKTLVKAGMQSGLPN
jgi:hypothetical protein